MIDRALGFGSPIRREAFYFQFWPNFIKLQEGSTPPPAKSSIRFSVYKGPQKFNENKFPAQLQANPYENTFLKKCQLNFYLPDFNPTRKIDFVIKLILITEEEQTQVGSYNISTAQLVNLFNQQNTKEVKKVQNIGQYVVEFDLFTQKTRYNLQKVVKQSKDKEQQTQATDSQPQTKVGNYAKQFPSQTSSQPKNKRFQRINKEVSTPKPISIPKQQKKQQKVQQDQKQVKTIPNIKLNVPQEQKVQSRPQKVSVNRLKPKGSIQSPTTPAIDQHKLRATKTAKTSQQVKKQLVKESIKLDTQQQSKTQIKPVDIPVNTSNQGSSNIKIIVFLILSFFAMYWAMTPTRRAPYKKIKK